MRWLWLVAAAVCFIVPFLTNSIGLGGVSLLAALVFLIVGVLSLASSRIESRGRDATTMLGADELRLMREQAERRKAGGGAAVGYAAGSGASNDLDSVSADGGSNGGND